MLVFTLRNKWEFRRGKKRQINTNSMNEWKKKSYYI